MRALRKAIGVNLKGLNNKTKLTIYKNFGGEVKFQRYLNGVGDAGIVYNYYSLNYVLEHMDLMRNWVDIEVEKVSVCVICAVRTVKVWVTFFCNCPVYSEHHALFLEHLKII